MTAADGGRGCPEDEPADRSVQYHMSDDEADKAFYARADRPRSPTSPVYGRSPSPAAPDDDDDLVAAADVMADAAGYSYSLSDDEAWPDFVYEYDPPDPAAARRQAEELAVYALHHYNADPSNGVKYEVVEATHNKYILVGYAHVNFLARPRGGGKERLFFAKVHRQLERDTMAPTCLRSLDLEDDWVGGLADEPWEDRVRADGAIFCFACHGALKHPKDDTCYKAGH